MPIRPGAVRPRKQHVLGAGMMLACGMGCAPAAMWIPAMTLGARAVVPADAASGLRTVFTAGLTWHERGTRAQSVVATDAGDVSALPLDEATAVPCGVIVACAWEVRARATAMSHFDVSPDGAEQ